MSGEVPSRDVPTEEEEEAETGEARPWTEFKNVVEHTTIDVVDRLSIVAGVNKYKGNYMIFLAKITDKNFQRSFFSMPAYVWSKAIPIIQGYVDKIGEIEKQEIAKQVLEELKRLKEMGIDVKVLAQQV
jgi:hypothetical protein